MEKRKIRKIKMKEYLVIDKTFESYEKFINLFKKYGFINMIKSYDIYASNFSMKESKFLLILFDENKSIDIIIGKKDNIKDDWEPFNKNDSYLLDEYIIYKRKEKLNKIQI